MQDQPGGGDSAAPVLVRIIARLNIGGPAIQAISLTRELRAHGFVTYLIRGCEEPHEGSMDPLARELGVRPLKVRSMRREVGWRDLPALWVLVRHLWTMRPTIVHTEAAKAGSLGRLASLMIGRRRRPIIAHTFHGHSLEGYFSARRAAVFLAIERFLARRTDLIIAVSEEVACDLVRLDVAPRSRIEVVPVGLDLSQFIVSDVERDRRRRIVQRQWGVAPGERVVTLVARLVPIKRVDRFLALARLLATSRSDLHFVIVGGGELEADLRVHPDAVALDRRLTWTGFVRDIPGVLCASDVVVLTSDNEGTPVSLIEAQAAGVPVVGTDVGGMRSAVLAGRTGYLVPRDDLGALARAVEDALRHGETLGRAGREHALAHFDRDAMVSRLVALYRERLRASARAPAA